MADDSKSSNDVAFLLAVFLIAVPLLVACLWWSRMEARRAADRLYIESLKAKGWKVVDDEKEWERRHGTRD